MVNTLVPRSDTVFCCSLSLTLSYRHCVLLQPIAQRPAIVLEARRAVATAPDESARETAQLQGESAGRALQETAESRIQLPGASARFQSHPLPHACVSTVTQYRSLSFSRVAYTTSWSVCEVSKPSSTTCLCEYSNSIP